MNEHDLSRRELAKMIDHANLHPGATAGDLKYNAEIALRFDVACLCVRPFEVADAAALLRDSDVAVGTVVGFPHGSSSRTVKIAEALDAIADGAVELDMVINIGKLREGDADYVRDEIAGVVQAAEERTVKVILECCYLDHDQMASGCRAAIDAGADFVKTSTGFGDVGATTENVAFLREQVGDRAGVKAAGGIRCLDDALAMIHAGATRLGTSSVEAILSHVHD